MALALQDPGGIGSFRRQLSKRGQQIDHVGLAALILVVEGVGLGGIVAFSHGLQLTVDHIAEGEADRR